MQKIKAAFDIGNSSVKGALLTDDNDLITNFTNDSLIAKVEDPNYLTFPEENIRYFQILDSNLIHDDGIFAVGSQAVALRNQLEYSVNTTSYKTSDPLTASLLFGNIIGKLQLDDLSVKLAASIPINEAKSIGTVNKYRNQLLGNHNVRVYTANGTQDINVNFSDVRITNEGQTGFFGLLDPNDADFKRAMDVVYHANGIEASDLPELTDFIVVDIGEKTIDVTVFINKKFAPDLSFSIVYGVGNLLEDAIRNAERENLTITSRHELQKVMSSDSKFQVKRRKQWDRFVQPAKQKLYQTVVDTIAQAYANRDYFDAIIFEGGGYSNLTGEAIENNQVTFADKTLFNLLDDKLTSLNKEVALTFGLPQPFSTTANRRGLTQIATIM